MCTVCVCVCVIEKSAILLLICAACRYNNEIVCLVRDQGGAIMHCLYITYAELTHTCTH